MAEKKKMAIQRSKENDIDKSLIEYENGLVQYLVFLGLPEENVLVPISERKIAIMNLPHAIEQLEETARNESTYLSKFVAAIGVGLFDAALNFIWDETIKNLRLKVAKFDLDYFYSSTITDADRRKKFSNENDLVKLDDWELIRGCLLTGLLTEIGYKHLDYIRDMRNWASAAHPNQIQLTGLQLVTWLQTCIKEVIAKEPISSAIEIKRLLHNIRTQTITHEDVSHVQEHMALMPIDIAISFLRTIFGMYTDDKVAVNVKANIKLVAKQAWDISPHDIRFELGIKYRTFAANAEVKRKDSAREFLEYVDGLSFLPPDTFQLEMNQAIQNLYNAHIGFNNFHNESPHARILFKYVPSTGLIPKELRVFYVKTVTMCTIGNGYGVSNSAYEYYSKMINLFQDAELIHFCYLPKLREFASRLQLNDCGIRFKNLSSTFMKKTSNTNILTLLDLFDKTLESNLQNVAISPVFKSIFTNKR